MPWTFSTWRAWCHKPRSGTTAQGCQQKGNFPLTTPHIYQDREEEHLARCPWRGCLYMEGVFTSPFSPGQKIDSCLFITSISRITRIAIIPSREQSSCYLATFSWVPPLLTVALGIKFPCVSRVHAANSRSSASFPCFLSCFSLLGRSCSAFEWEISGFTTLACCL